MEWRRGRQCAEGVEARQGTAKGTRPSLVPSKRKMSRANRLRSSGGVWTTSLVRRPVVTDALAGYLRPGERSLQSNGEGNWCVEEAQPNWRQHRLPINIW